ETGGDRHLGGEMKDRAHVLKRLLESHLVPHVADAQLDLTGVAAPQPLYVAFDAGTGEIVEDTHPPPLAGQPIHQVAADETRAAGDERPLLVAIPIVSASATFAEMTRCSAQGSSSSH